MEGMSRYGISKHRLCLGIACCHLLYFAPAVEVPAATDMPRMSGLHRLGVHAP